MAISEHDNHSPAEEKDPKTAVYTVDTGVSEQRFSAVQTPKNKRYDDDDFWDLGEVRRKVYQKPSFADADVTNTLVEQEPTAEAAVRREPIPPAPQNRPAFTSVSYRRPADNTAIHGTSADRQVRTSRYTSPAARDVQNRQNEALRNMKTDKEYDCTGLLLRHVEIKPWTTNIQFYQRFAQEAAIFHERVGSPCPAVEFFAYVPQYSKMNDRQQNFYLYLRDSIRRGEYIRGDLSYVLLYIYEIINLPNLIPPAEGAQKLADIWLHYREWYPRIDVFLCEWVADYCLIHALPLPAALTPILPQIVQKAQFKEFYLDRFPEDDMTSLAHTLMEFSSDYDYKRSRYYVGNEDAYDEYIPRAVTEALTAACREKRGIFAFEKKYRVTRDAYCGAVTPCEIKKRIDVTFHSFTRPLETRQIITGLVKYAENRLRLTLRIKAKLGVSDLPEADRTVIDRFFAPMMPEKTLSKAAAQAAEEREYLKLYEAETTGFDFGAAEQIEQLSWGNTNILTAAEEAPASEEAPNPKPTAEAPDKEAPPASAVPAPESPDKQEDDTDEHAEEKEALRAAWNGNFRRFCRDNGYFESDMASTINEIFLDIIGDIVLTDEGGDYQLIEDYREDVEEWLN